MGIRVMEDWTTCGQPAVNDPECTRCGTCVDQCLGDVLDVPIMAGDPFRKLADIAKYHAIGHKVFSYGNPQMAATGGEE